MNAAEETRSYSHFKFFTGLVFVLLFAFSIAVFHSNTDPVYDVREKQYESAKTLSAGYMLAEHYNQTNQTSKKEQVLEILNSTERPRGYNERLEALMQRPVNLAALYTGLALEKIDPFYPVPCYISGYEKGCAMYISDNRAEALTGFNATSIVKEFEREHNFSTNYTPEGGSGTTLIPERESFSYTSALFNVLYLFAFGYILAAVAEFSWRRLRTQLNSSQR